MLAWPETNPIPQLATRALVADNSFDAGHRPCQPRVRFPGFWRLAASLFVVSREEKMQLELGSGATITDPKPGQLYAALAALPGGDSYRSFAILAADEHYFVQASGSYSGGFILEYQEGSMDNHFQCENTELDFESVVKAFQSYYRRDPHWNSNLEWKRMELPRE